MATKSKALQKDAPASTSVAVRKPAGGAVVSIQAALAAQAASMADRTLPPSGSKIKLSPGKMSLPDGTQTPGPIESVVVDFIARNMFYPTGYDKNNIVPPVCFAQGTDPRKLAPSPNSPEPQATDCASCAMNAFGSAPNGKGKACKNERLLALLPPDDAEAPLWTLSVSPTGTKGFDGYVTGVVRTFNVPPVGVVTEIGLDANSEYPVATFGNPQPVADPTDFMARQAEARDLLMVEPDLTGYKAAPAPKKGAQRPAARR